jgi:serine/threonine protein phosphatase PrpC
VGEKVFQRKHLRKKITHNDDKGVFAVCDGMGGHPGGKAASRFFCNRLRADLAQAPSLTRSETLIASLVGMQAASMSRLATGSATTLAGVAIDSRWAVIFNAGDSRVYRWRDRHLQCVSHDHSPVQEMLDHELISEEEAFVHPYRNLVSFGMGPAFTKTWREELLFFRREAMGDDIFLICSDGVSDLLPARVMEDVLEGDPLRNAPRLMHSLREMPLKDNTSYVVVSMGDES